jgi:hypothetical protein
MGLFLAVTAIRAEHSRVANAVCQYAQTHGVKCKGIEFAEGRGPSDRTDASIFRLENGWSRVLWPAYFNVHDFPVAQFLSAELSTLVSTINVYDGDTWAHGLFENGEELDRFGSVPSLYAEGEDNLEAVVAAWSGKPNVVAAAVGCSPEVLSRYFQHAPEGGFDENEAKAFPDDEFDRNDVWVLVDFWRRMGITYPDGSPPDAHLRMEKDFSKKLPTG